MSKPRGFAAMSQERRSAIAALGGRAVPADRRGYSLASPEVRAADGRKGGLNVKDELRSFSQDRNLASAAGRRSGEARRAKREARNESNR